MGAVYLAKQISLDREVAVKILPRELSSDPEFRASFQTEARAMAKLNHPNLISIYDSGDVDGMLYISMEYVSGKSLYHSAWNKKVDLEESSRIIIAICEGLSHAHENGIIHRDIKPANILLTPKIEPKIGDFGLAQAVGVKHEGIVMGTPGYAAPEVISHPELADRRSDIFAVGVMFHELLTAEKPQPNVLTSSLCRCGHEFDLIIQRATHPNPVMRYSDAMSMASAIRDAIKSVSSTAGAARASVASSRAPLPVRAGVRPAGTGKTAAARVSPVPGKMPTHSAGKSHPTDSHGATDLRPSVKSAGKAGQNSTRNFLIAAALAVLAVLAYFKIQSNGKSVDTPEQVEILKKKVDAISRSFENGKGLEDLKNRTIGSSQSSNPSADSRAQDARNLEKEMAMQSLERLKFDLAKGSRQPMPKGTTRRGELDFFLVTQPMSWDAALLFAEEHGGCMAFPGSDEELGFLASLLKNHETIWIGAGRNDREKWTLLDGSSWAISKTPSGIGNYATLSQFGSIVAAEASLELPFVIVWQRDGSNPSTLEKSLQRTRQSLNAGSPVFPPGTMSLGTRRFLPIMRSMTRQQATEFAQQAGAHVAALSHPEEGAWAKERLNSFKAQEGIWLAGEKVAGVWQWSTKEPWTYAQWSPASPDSEESATLLIYLPERGWHNIGRDKKADGVLLEWSKDAGAAKNANGNVSDTASAIGPLLNKCRELLVASLKERDDKHAANVKSFSWDLDMWMRGPKSQDRSQWQETIEVMKKLTLSGRVPSEEEVQKECDTSLSSMHESIVKIHSSSLIKQKDIDSSYESRNRKIRDSFVLKLKEIGSAAHKSGQQDLVKQLKDYLEKTDDLDGWVESMLEQS